MKQIWRGNRIACLKSLLSRPPELLMVSLLPHLGRIKRAQRPRGKYPLGWPDDRFPAACLEAHNPIVKVQAFICIKNLCLYQSGTLKKKRGASTNHSYFRDSAGLAKEAFVVWKTTVARAMTKARNDERKKIQILISVLYANPSSHLVIA